MKRFFLSAVVISILCSSCETDNEVFTTEIGDNYKSNQSTALSQAKGVEVNSYQTYQNIINSFVYDKQQTHQENLLLFEQHVNQQIPNYVQQETYKYENIDNRQLWLLKQTDTSIIEVLAYSKETKLVIYAILNNSFENTELDLLTNESERNLVETLLALHSNGDDDEINDNRSIAFAYGAQYNLTQAILYAGAIELSVK